MAYQSRLARTQRDGKQAAKDVVRLEDEVAALSEDLTRTREPVSRYEAALFEGYPVSDIDLQAQPLRTTNIPLSSRPLSCRQHKPCTNRPMPMCSVSMASTILTAQAIRTSPLSLSVAG